MRPVFFSFLDYPVGAYGLFMAVGHVAGITFLLLLARNKRVPIGPLLDILFAVMIFGLVGARLGYAYNHWDEFRDHSWDLLSLQKGGLSFFGGFAPAFFAFLAVARWHRLPILQTSDLMSPVLPFTLALIRIGCFAQGCCYGIPSAVPWAVTFTRIDGKVPSALLYHPLHPSQLYESVFLFLLALFLAVAQRRAQFLPGLLAIFSIFSYCLFRFCADFLRGDLTKGFWGLDWMTPTQAAASLGLLATPIVLAVCLRTARKI